MTFDPAKGIDRHNYNTEETFLQVFLEVLKRILTLDSVLCEHYGNIHPSSMDSGNNNS